MKVLKKQAVFLTKYLSYCHTYLHFCVTRLALQASAGGVRLECMVVDEGFGTLDPEALDAAVHALEELQAGGRLVGVISHVPEMKERIPIRLEVVKNRTGSTASFIL